MMENEHTKEEDIELITEWPVTKSYKGDDSHQSTSHISESSQYFWPQIKRNRHFPLAHLRQGKRQHQSVSADTAVKQTAQDCDATEGHSETHRENVHCEPCNEDCVSSVALKIPRTELDADLFVQKSICSKKGQASQEDKRNLEGSNSENCTAVSDRLAFKQKNEKMSSSTAFASLTASRAQDTNKDSADISDRELLVQPRIARWWRKQGRCLTSSCCQGKRNILPSSTNPNTLIFHVARLPEGQAFLAEERQKLKEQVASGKSRAEVLAALGSVEEWLGNIDEAVRCLKQAVAKEPDNREWRWLLHKVQRHQKMRRRQTELLTSMPLHPVFPHAQQVDRVSCKDLSFADFFHHYALCRRPVIITDMVSSMTTVPWDLQHIREIAGDCQAKVKQSVPGSVEWAGLEDSRLLKVSEFLDSLQEGCHDYLFDWSLPLHCPCLVQELTIPRYFAGDFLQRSVPGSLYQDSWPSLFIAPSGVHSGLHVDAFASNFWMALFQGRKRWVFFQEEDLPCLYPVYCHSLDPTFEASIVDPDLKTHPLLAYVHPVECILNAGELLFVPGGSPHYVENLDTTLAISANFVDLSNFTRVLDELDISGLLDPQAADLAQQFRRPNFVSAMKIDMADLPWKDFKNWPPSDVDSYCLKHREGGEKTLKELQ